MQTPRRREIREMLLREQDGRCAYCCRPISFSESTLDHIVPRSRGGRGVRSNAVAACRTCNTSKADMTPNEWFDHIHSVLHTLERAFA